MNLHPMACLARVPFAWGKVSLGAPTQSVRGSTDAKNELGVKGRRKLSRTLHIAYLFLDSSESFI